ncbi:MAG TPA: LPD38 domain-containing protein, partial [Gammaproteobacteria bacterium]|nr:LPD38 domain-containing protein [Gammaproteobacteria bacterium]
PRAEDDGQEPKFSRNKQQGTVAGAAGNSPELDAALDKAGLKEPPAMRDRVRAYFDQGSDVIKQDLENAKNRILEGVFDRYHGIKTAQFKAKGLLPAEQDAYVAARLSTGTPTVLSTLLVHGHLEWKDGILQVKDGTKGLLDTLAPVKDDLNAWMGWMIGNRAKRLSGEGRENLFKPDEIAALIKLGDGKEELFKKVRADYATLKTSVLKAAADAGLLDEDSMKAWDHADHIPFYRLGETEQVQAPGGRRGLSHQNSGIRQLKGGTAELNDPLENILMNFTYLLDASLKNNAVRMVESNLRDTGVLEKLGPEYTQALVPMSQVKKIMEDAGVDTSMATPDVLNGVRKMLAFKAPSDPDVIRVMDKGKASYFRVHDAPLLRALTAFNEKSAGGLMNPLRFFKRVLTSASTVSPGFMARVWVRDSLTANVIAKHRFPVVWGSAKGLYQSLTESGGQVDLMAAGASFHGGNISAHDPEQNAKMLRRMLRRKGFDAASADHFVSTVVDSPARLWDLWRRGSEAVENSNREAVYEAALKAGESKAEAAYNAKDLLDYSMRGNFAAVKFFTDAIPFLNARLQGLYKIGRAGAIPGIAEQGFKAKVAGKGAMSLAQQVAIRGAMISMASLALYAYNRNDKRYQQLPDWDKDTYWHIFIGDQHYRIPKPFEVGLIFGTMPERWARLVDGDDTLRKSFNDWVWNMGQVMNLDPLPQAIKPAYDVYANKDSFSGNPIENESDQALLPADRYSSATSPTMVAMGRHISDQTGVSPKQMQELYSGYTGALGMFLLSMVDDGERLMEHQPPRATARVDEMPPLSSFIRGSGPAKQTQWEQDFYDARQQVNETYASIRKQIAVAQLAGDEGAVDRMQKLMDTNQDNLGLRDSLNDAAQQLSAIRQRIDLIQEDDKMAPDAKREAIDELYEARNDLMEKVYTNLPPDLK